MPPSLDRSQLFGVSCSALLDGTLPAHEGCELFDRDTSLANEGPKGALRDFAVIWNGKAPEGRVSMAKDDVTALLAVDFVPDLAKGSHSLATGDARKDAHTATSMTSS